MMDSFRQLVSVEDRDAPLKGGNSLRRVWSSKWRVITLLVAAVITVAYFRGPFQRSLAARRSSLQFSRPRAEALRRRRAAGRAQCGNNTHTKPTTFGTWCLSLAASTVVGGKNGLRKYVLPSGHVVADQGLANGLLKYLGKKGLSLIDIGAGVGQYGHWLIENNAGIRWTGYDGAENVEDITKGFVRWVDVTNSEYDTIPGRADWVMSLEVGEHIPPKTTNTFLDLLDRHNKMGVILSWAVEGQGGLGHINQKNNSEVISLMSERGYTQNEWCLEFQKTVRKNAKYYWFPGSFLVFVRRNPIL